LAERLRQAGAQHRRDQEREQPNGLDDQHLAIGHTVPMRIGITAEVEAMADHRLEIVFHQPRLDQRTFRQRAPAGIASQAQLYGTRGLELLLRGIGSRPPRPAPITPYESNS
jgi:hypothetical protein